MHSFKIVLAVMLSLTLLLSATNFALAIGPSSGYVQYKISVTSQDIPSPITAIVNETAKPSSQTGFIDLTLALSSSIGNLSYTRNINSSSLPETFPYLSGLTNQSLSYDYQGISLTANIVNTGQVPVTFNSTTYQATKYQVSFSATNSSSSTSFSGNGNITTMPSGLINTVQLSLNQTTSVNITLLATNLSLNAPANSINPIGASILGVILVAAAAIAAPTIFIKTHRSKQKNQAEKQTSSTQDSGTKQENKDEKKPPYWVD